MAILEQTLEAVGFDVMPTCRRGARRAWRSQPIWWMEQADDLLRQGWLLEQSETGAAFLSRGAGIPLPGVHIVATTADPRELESPMRSGRVMRVEHVHADLVLIAAQLDEGEEAN